jgi:hypothetical protein
LPKKNFLIRVELISAIFRAKFRNLLKRNGADQGETLLPKVRHDLAAGRQDCPASYMQAQAIPQKGTDRLRHVHPKMSRIAGAKNSCPRLYSGTADTRQTLKNRPKRQGGNAAKLIKDRYV